jgi:hypothetical protein
MHYSFNFLEGLRKSINNFRKYQRRDLNPDSPDTKMCSLLTLYEDDGYVLGTKALVCRRVSSILG